jgi:hypothetical protein
MSLDYACFQAILPRAIATDTSVRELLHAFESVDALKPDYWGPSPGLRDPYVASDVIEYFSREKDAIGSLVRTRPPRLTVKWYAWESLTSVQVVLPRGADEAAVELFFESLDPLVDALGVDFAHVDIRFVVPPPPSATQPSSSYHSPETYRACGLEHVFARNYFSPRLQAEFERSGSQCLHDWLQGSHRLPGGAARVDLQPTPWRAAPEALEASRVAVERCLLESGFLAHRVNNRLTPGPRWIPPDV